MLSAVWGMVSAPNPWVSFGLGKREPIVLSKTAVSRL